MERNEKASRSTSAFACAAVSVELPRRIHRTTDRNTAELSIQAARRIADTPARSRDFKAGIFMKLMIVEDNAEMRQLLRGVVADVADEVAECSDGEEAVATYAAQQPDWVLMDL